MSRRPLSRVSHGSGRARRLGVGTSTNWKEAKDRLVTPKPAELFRKLATQVLARGLQVAGGDGERHATGLHAHQLWNLSTPMGKDARPIGAKIGRDGEHRPSPAGTLAKMSPLDAPINREKFGGGLDNHPADALCPAPTDSHR